MTLPAVALFHRFWQLRRIDSWRFGHPRQIIKTNAPAFRPRSYSYRKLLNTAIQKVIFFVTLKIQKILGELFKGLQEIPLVSSTICGLFDIFAIPIIRKENNWRLAPPTQFNRKQCRGSGGWSLLSVVIYVNHPPLLQVIIFIIIAVQGYHFNEIGLNVSFLTRTSFWEKMSFRNKADV